MAGAPLEESIIRDCYHRLIFDVAWPTSTRKLKKYSKARKSAGKAGLDLLTLEHFLKLQSIASEVFSSTEEALIFAQL